MERQFTAEQWVAADLERVFRFFSDPRNLLAISPPRAGAKLVGIRLVLPVGVPEGVWIAGPGSEIVVSVRILPWLPFRIQWTARITGIKYGRLFAYFEDEQVNGPFELWRHRHEFEPAERNGHHGTVIRDRVEYKVGLGPLGTLVDVLAMQSMVEQMFEWRHSATERLLSLVE